MFRILYLFESCHKDQLFIFYGHCLANCITVLIIMKKSKLKNGEVIINFGEVEKLSK